MKRIKHPPQKHQSYGAAVNNLLTEYYQKGMITSMAIILLGYYNTADDYVAEDKQAEFFKKMEEEGMITRSQRFILINHDQYLRMKEYVDRLIYLNDEK